jgi:hypothetical protein
MVAHIILAANCFYYGFSREEALLARSGGITADGELPAAAGHVCDDQ